MEHPLAGKNYLVTGVTSGIGLAVAEQLTLQGATVFGVGRNSTRCAQTEETLRSLPGGGQVRVLTADLASRGDIDRLAESVYEHVKSLDGLINNAGAFTFTRRVTEDGFELQWAVNHLAPFVLTHALLPLLRAAPTARVVTVSSGSHYHTRLRWWDLQLHFFYNGLLAYKQTKLCNVLFSAELNRRLGADRSVRAFAADPGLVNTEMGFKYNPPLVRWIWELRRRRGILPAESARGVIFLATEPSIQNSNEVYWKHSRPKPPNPFALSPRAGARLWEISARMCGLPD
jgi:retinol dehydrogenase 12